MNRNVAIVTTILVVVVIAGYFVWLRSRYQQPIVAPNVEEVVVSPSPIESPSLSATPSASPKKEATKAAEQKVSTQSSRNRQ